MFTNFKTDNIFNASMMNATQMMDGWIESKIEQ